MFYRELDINEELSKFYQKITLMEGDERGTTKPVEIHDLKTLDEFDIPNQMEIHILIISAKKGTAPGVDNITIDVLKKLCPEICETLFFHLERV